MNDVTASGLRVVSAGSALSNEPSEGLDSTVEVAVVAVVKHTSEGVRVLIARRLPDRHLGGLWELPGGRIEAHETVARAALREVREETGIVLDDVTPLHTVEHAYETRRVRLHAVLATVGAQIEAQPLASTEVRWVAPAQLDAFDWPDANAPIIEALRATLAHTNK